MFLLSSCMQMTPEERAKIIELHTKTYEVVSVYQYISVKTNQFGGIVDQELTYCFTYIGDDGQLHQDEICNLEYGLTKVEIGETNKYVVQDTFDTYRTLFLTRNTINSLNKT